MRTITQFLMGLSLVLTATLSLAGGKPFNQAEFNALQQKGAPIVLTVHADWCSTCKKQAPILQKQMDQANNQAITFFVLDFDKEKAALRDLRISRQSTLVAYKGGQEVKRSTGDTSVTGIEALVASVR